MNALSDMPDPRIPRVSRKSNGFNRNDVVNAFVSAFEVIGGIDRLALWANANPDKFFPLYAKLLPATTQVIGDIGTLEIIHRIAPTKLDQHEDGVYAPEDECQPSNLNTLHVNTSERSTDAINDGVYSSPTDEPEKQ